MEDLLMKMLEKAKENHKGLKMLKDTAVRCQQYALAAKLRDIEIETFPETQEQKDAKALGKELSLLFRMVELNISDDVCWLIAKTFESHRKKKGKFSIDEAVTLRFKREELFTTAD